MAELADLCVLFGYACKSDERIHRNRISRKMSYGVHEAWVGRNYTNRLPGLYWITLIPDALIRKINISLDALRGVAMGTSLHKNRTWLVRLYRDPAEWVSEAGRIDGWCARTPGCFDKARAESSFASATNFIDASAAIEEWS
jgi:hypothetical protein